jgi:hypothetical protein
MFAPTSLLIFTSFCTLFAATPSYFPGAFEKISCAEQICSRGTCYFVPQKIHHYLPPCLRLHRQHPSLPQDYGKRVFPEGYGRTTH